MTIQKYRPSLTALELAHLEKLAKQDALENNSSISLGIVGKLAPFLAKINNGAINPAYTTTPKQSIEEALGMLSPTYDRHVFQNEVYEGKEAYWKACYKVYQVNPESLTLKEIQAAKEHMYLNDLMTPEEMVEFEKAAFPNITHD